MAGARFSDKGKKWRKHSSRRLDGNSETPFHRADISFKTCFTRHKGNGDPTKVQLDKTACSSFIARDERNISLRNPLKAIRTKFLAVLNRHPPPASHVRVTRGGVRALLFFPLFDDNVHVFARAESIPGRGCNYHPRTRVSELSRVQRAVRHSVGGNRSCHTRTHTRTDAVYFKE